MTPTDNIVYDKNGHVLQLGNIVSDDNTDWLVIQVFIRNLTDDPCGYVVGEHNDRTEKFPIRYTDGGAMCFGLKFVRDEL